MESLELDKKVLKAVDKGFDRLRQEQVDFIAAYTEALYIALPLFLVIFWPTVPFIMWDMMEVMWVKSQFAQLTCLMYVVFWVVMLYFAGWAPFVYAHWQRCLRPQTARQVTIPQLPGL